MSKLTRNEMLELFRGQYLQVLHLRNPAVPEPIQPLDPQVEALLMLIRELENKKVGKNGTSK